MCNNNTELPLLAVLLIILAAIFTAKFIFHLDHMYFLTNWLGGIKN